MPDKQLIEGLIDDIRSRLGELRAQEVNVASQAWGVKPRARDYMGVLGEKGVVNKDLADKLAAAMSVRNRLVHEYGQISKQKLAKFVAEDLGDIDEYIKQINKFIR